MRRVEKPPVFTEKSDYGVLLNGLINIDRFGEFREIEDNSYPYWEKWKYLAQEWGVEPKMIWETVKASRYGKREVNFSGLGDKPFYINTPLIVQKQLHELDLNLRGSLHASELIPSEEKQRYLISSLMEEAIASSQLEGAATTRKLAKEMLENNRKPRTHSEQMIHNNYAAMQWITKNMHVDMTPERILEMHLIITGNTLTEKKEEGAFRESDDVHIVDVQTGNILHTPPGHLQLQTLMEEFCRFANDKKKDDFFLHPISKAIILHFLIGYIHPFADGNGRTARALFYWYLIKKGYWLIEYMSVSRVILGSKAQYARAYQHTEFDENDLTYFIIYNLKAISRALTELKSYIERKNKEKQSVLNLLKNTDFNDRQILILQEILNEKKTVFTVTEIENKFQVSNQTARSDLNQLVDKGILLARKSGKKTQFLLTENGIKKII